MHCFPRSRAGASELNQTINSTTAPDAPGDWAQREQEALDRSKLPAGVDESTFGALLASPLYKDLQEIENENDEIEEQAFVMLHAWAEDAKENATSE